MQTIYRPGQWYLIVIPGALVALPPDVPGDVVAQLWERMPAQKSLATVVDVLTAHAGGAFASLPPFVAAVAEGSDIRIALRGGVSARVSTATESHSFSGAEVTTWSERFVGGASRVEITVETVEGTAALPVQSGVVRVAAVSAELETDDDRPLAAALGPVPVIETGAAGVSAAVLAGTPAPSIADFGGVVPAASDVVPEPEVPAEPESEDAAPAEPLTTEALPVSDDPYSDVAPVAPEDVAPEDVAPDADEPSADEESVDGSPIDGAPAAEPVDPLDELFGDVEDSTDAEPAPEVDDATILPTEVTLAPSTEDFDQLWGATVHSVPTAGAAAAAAPAVAPASPFPDQGDHDGATISAAELRALRQQPPVGNDAPTAVIPVTPGATGRIRVSTGQVVALDRTVIIGRRPRSTRASGANLPHLIAVESPQQDISRSHLEIRPEGDTVVVIDLHTTNGSTLLRPGADPIRLHPGEQTLVLSGDVVDLGDGVKVAFEDLP
ncbi:FHA domain-containing protein [Microbacterium sp. EST19A]|uniref:FHA domain-containing protein n=1 Tax=Microbacterium sp. EST19A TaxID=2862681 RepID=UPI001CC0BB71|nr:FHA domain-containing protein [Microbacterium sp. EST19A]